MSYEQATYRFTNFLVKTPKHDYHCSVAVVYHDELGTAVSAKLCDSDDMKEVNISFGKEGTKPVSAKGVVSEFIVPLFASVYDIDPKCVTVEQVKKPMEGRL